MLESSPIELERCGKRRNCSLRAISAFPTEFSKDLHCGHVKPGLVWERVRFVQNGGKFSNRIENAVVKMRNVSFSHGVFKRLARIKKRFFGKGNPFRQNYKLALFLDILQILPKQNVSTQVNLL